MALMDAKEYDPRPAQRRWRWIAAAVAVVVVPLLVWYFFLYYWPEKHAVNKFFEAIERQDFDAAYGIKNADPDWKQHAEKYNDYTLPQFKLDWGPSSEYGPITKHAIDCALEPKRRDSTASGVIVVVIVNGRAEPASLWVEKKSKTITQSPFQVQCRPPR